MDEVFSKWIGERGRLLYLPFASRAKEDGYASHLSWLTSVFEPLGVTSIEMWEQLAPHDRRSLDRFDGIYIGGGNTFKLLYILKRSGFDKHLWGYAKDGGAVYGGSAGAILLGHDIASCAHDDPNLVGLEDTRALNFLDGADVWCHYQATQRDEVQAYCNRYDRKVWALTERSGLRVENGEIDSVGFESATLFVPSNK